jgi:GntR family transcriptional regulator
VADETLWRQVHDGLRDQITGGQLKPGERLPSEPQLMDAYGVRSRGTVIRAVRELVGEGLIDERRRVIQRQPITLRVSDEETITFIEDIVAAGHTAGPPEIAVGHRGGNVVRTVLRKVDGEPHNWAEWLFPIEVAQGTRLDFEPDIEEGSVRYLKEGLGWTELVQEKWLESRPPKPEEAAALKIPAGQWVIVEHRTGKQDGKLLFESDRIIRADRTRLIP